MRACMLAYTFYETDNRVMRYAEELASRGDDVDVVALRRPGQANFEVINGVAVYRIQERKIDEKGRLSYLYKILAFLARSSLFITRMQTRAPYDIVHIHSVPDFEVFAAWWPKLTGAKIILDIHDIVPEFYAAKFHTSDRSILFKLLVLAEKASASFADHVIISNHIWEKKLLERTVPPDKCTTILNYPSDLWFRPIKRTRQNGKFIIIYPGSLNWHQGLDIAIDAVARIAEKAPDVELHIYGEGPSKPELKEQAARLRLQQHIKFRDSVPISEIPHIMINADLGVIPKRNDKFGGEAFSTKTLEFMSVGVPIIVSRTKVDSYYFNDSVVRFFKPGDPKDLANCILDLKTNKQKRLDQAKRASEFVTKFTWKTNRHIYLDIINRLLKTRLS